MTYLVKCPNIINYGFQSLLCKTGVWLRLCLKASTAVNRAAVGVFAMVHCKTPQVEIHNKTHPSSVIYNNFLSAVPHQ